MAAGSGDVVRLGAARAGGERRRRRSTPLVQGSEHGRTPVEPVEVRDDPVDDGAADTTPDTTPDRTPDRSSSPRPPEDGRPTRARGRRTPGGGSAGSTREDEPEDEPEDVPDAQGATPRVVQQTVEALVEAFVAEASRAGLENAEERVARALAFVRRRLSGDFTVDEFGFDPELTDVLLPVLLPLYRQWFRVEVRGLENVPAEGGALVVANHSGTVALDSLMTQVAVHYEHPQKRYLRMLGADLVFNTPFVGQVARKTGSTLATNADAERLLRAGELVGVWPEGFKGVGKPFTERYKLQRFGRGGFVSAAIATGVPIVPCSIVGAEEIYPIIGNLKTAARVLGVPYVPVTPTFPWLGPLGLVPLPSKWIIQFGTPIEPATGATAADDPMVVFDVTDQVRETIQQTLYALLMQRRSVFF